MAVLVFDTFAGADGTDIEDHAPDIDVIGGGWSSGGAVDSVELDGSGAVKFLSGSDAAWIDIGTTDQITKININVGGVDNRFQLVGRSDSAVGTQGTNYSFNVRPAVSGADNIYLYKRVAGGGVVTLAAAEVMLNPSTTYELELSVIGSELSAKIDGVEQLTATDSEISTGTYTGFYHALFTDNALRVYDFQAEDVGGLIEVAPTLGTISYSGNATTIGLFGSIDVTATLGTISYAGNNTTVGLFGVVDVTAGLGTISYTSNNTTIQVSGAIEVNPTLGAISYTSNATTVQVSGSVDVTATLGAISYTSNNTVVDLGGAITVAAGLGTINYASNDTIVGLAGQIGINATLGTISYTSNNTIVIASNGQSIGEINTSFAGDLYGSNFKPNSITVTFRG